MIKSTLAIAVILSTGLGSSVFAFERTSARTLQMDFSEDVDTCKYTAEVLNSLSTPDIKIEANCKVVTTTYCESAREVAHDHRFCEPGEETIELGAFFAKVTTPRPGNFPIHSPVWASIDNCQFAADQLHALNSPTLIFSADCKAHRGGGWNLVGTAKVSRQGV